MKYIVLFFAVAGALMASAQVRKRDVFVEGTAGFGRQERGPDHTTTFRYLSPSAGFMISEKTAVIAGWNWERSRNEIPTASTEYKSFTAFSGVRRFFPLSDRTYLFVEGVAGYGENRHDAGPVLGFLTSRQNLFYLQVAPGFIFFPSPRWALTARAGNLFFGFGSGNSDSELVFQLGALNLGVLFRLTK